MTEENVTTDDKNTAIVPRQGTADPFQLATARQIEQLTVEMAQKDIWPKAPIDIVRKAVHIAKARGANPWCDEIYLIPRNEKQRNGSYITRWVTQMSQNYVIKVATSHPACEGWEDGVIIQDDKGKLVDLAGCFVPKGWTLVGSWFRGHRKGFKVPITKRINLEEYSTGMSTWKKLQSTMIVKVARTQGLREMLPDRLSGMYDASEMDQMGAVVDIPDARPALPAESVQPPQQVESEQEFIENPPQEDTPPPQTLPPAKPEKHAKDDEKIEELGKILMDMTEGDIEVSRTLLATFSSFDGFKGTPITSLKDPRLKGKWLYRILGTAKDAQAKQAGEREPGSDDGYNDPTEQEVDEALGS